jgi:hypothetical protein
MSFPTSAT